MTCYIPVRDIMIRTHSTNIFKFPILTRYKVAPAELEHLLQTHPEITDAAVIPYPHEEAGQIPVAFVVRKSGSLLNEKQIIDFVAKQVAPYKKIRKVFFLDSIPKNAPGKVLKKELIKLSASGAASKL